MLDDVNTAARPGGAEAAASSLLLRFSQVKSLLQKEFGDTAFRSWIQPVEALRFNAGTLELGVPTRFIRDWVKSHYADRIRSLWQQNFGPIARVDIIISDKKPAAAAEPQHTVTAYAEPAVANQNTGAPAVDDLSSPLDPRFTFDNFVVGRSNELAANAAKAVANGTSRLNPLFLQGGVGLGKTHLMQAVAHAVRTADPTRKVAYMSAEKFMYQFVKALRAKDTMSFKAALRGIDILMVDDIQFICGKDQTQEEFIHTFNALIDQGKQIIVSADKSPAELDGLGERLRSRLGMGLVAAITATTPELRLEILHAKCKMLGRHVAEDVLQFLAQKISSNVRELEGALNRLIAHAELAGRALNVDTASDVLQDLLRAHERRVSVEDIQKKVAEHYGIRLADMHSPRRARPVARPRQVAMYLAKALTTHSLPEIGRKFGGRDHTTIIHGVRKVEELMAQDASIRDDVDAIKRAISG
jgi:chromosomal replication initiator protein